MPAFRQTENKSDSQAVFAVFHSFSFCFYDFKLLLFGIIFSFLYLEAFLSVGLKAASCRYDAVAPLLCLCSFLSDSAASFSLHCHPSFRRKKWKQQEDRRSQGEDFIIVIIFIVIIIIPFKIKCNNFGDLITSPLCVLCGNKYNKYH